MSTRRAIITPAQDRQHTAFHEAGHAVVGYAFGIPLKAIRIAAPGATMYHMTPHGPAAFAAHTDLDWGAYQTRDTDGRALINMAVAVGGFVANTLWPCTSPDYDQFSATDDFRDVEMMFVPGTPDDVRHQTTSDALRVARNILTRHGEAVERIAVELLHRNVLPGSEVWAICDAVFEPLFEAAGRSNAYIFEGVSIDSA